VHHWPNKIHASHFEQWRFSAGTKSEKDQKSQKDTVESGTRLNPVLPKAGPITLTQHNFTPDERMNRFAVTDKNVLHENDIIICRSS
jgi:hypothetical protein